MSKFETALRLIDEAHSLDPTLTTVNTNTNETKTIPYELHYAHQMTKYLNFLRPSAPETLQLAIRAQHLRRWEVSRSSYPSTKPGYYAWRGYLAKRQGEIAEKICLEAGYSVAEAERVSALIRKEGLKTDADTQTLEDVACLVFLEEQLDGFRRGYEEEKVVGILRKTWAKMSPGGREMALKIEMEGDVRLLVERAVSGV